ncbi:hypothetical protein OKW50_007942 [Paraburkholderia youngii]
MTPLQPRYAKRIADADSLMAVIIAQATNLGNLAMSQTCDIPYHTLDETYRQYCRLATLRAANDRVANFIAQLPIFEYYSSDLGALFGAIDGQKFAAATPTAKARHSANISVANGESSPLPPSGSQALRIVSTSPHAPCGLRVR